MTRLVLQPLALLLVFSAMLSGQGPAPGMPADKDAEIERLSRENRALRLELENLRKDSPSDNLKEPAGTPSGPGSIRSTGWVSREALLVAVPAALIVGTVLAWFIVLVPRRRRRPLLEARAILARNDPKDLPDVERLLGQALTAGLRSADVADARFNLAYVRARLERYAEAEATLEDLDKSGAFSREAAYLQIWVLARQRKHEEVERLYDRHVALLDDVLDTRRIVSITFLHLGRKSLALRATASALDYFDRVRTLGTLADQIPADLADHHLILGLGAVFEQNWEDARKHFNAAAKASTANASTIDSPNGRLGLLVCDWREHSDTDVDDELGDLLPAVEAALVRHRTRMDSKGKQRSAEQNARKANGEVEPDEPALLLAACRLWYLFAILRKWTLRPKRVLPTGADREVLATRVAAVKDADSALAEPWLVEGLIGYYFAGADFDARTRAVAALEEAVTREMSVPEVLMLLSHENAQRQLMREGVPTYMKLMRSYLENSEVSEGVRREVREQLAHFERFRELDGIEITTGETDAAPSIAELQSRVEIIHRRISELVRPRLTMNGNQAAEAELDSLAHDIKETTDVLRERAKHLEMTEGRLTVYAGEMLLAEESAEPEGV